MLTTLLIGGALADRYERRRLMIISDVSRGFFTPSDILVVSFAYAAFLWIAPLASKRLRSAA
jgi:MFS family permease